MLTIEQIKKEVTDMIIQSINNQDVEHPKFDFKRKWYDLKSAKDIIEFVKDTTAIANTFGLDGLIVIGFDERTKEFHNAKFSDSGLKDKTELDSILIRRISNSFEINEYDFLINGNQISVIHIPPSIEKPHIIKNYQTFKKDGTIQETQQVTFVRKNSRTYPASKYDFDLMYYDKKNIVPDYNILIVPISVHVKGNSVNSHIQIIFDIENLGRRPVAFLKYRLEVIDSNGESEFFNGKNVWTRAGKKYSIGTFTEIVSPQKMINLVVDLNHHETYDDIRQIIYSDKNVKIFHISSSDGLRFQKEFELR